jgi:hypothetical protein
MLSKIGIEGERSSSESGRLMAAVWCHRLRRAFASGSRVLLVAGPPILTVAVAAGTKTLSVNVVSLSWWIIIGGVIGVILLLLQAGVEYQVRTYDGTLAFRFDDQFYGDEMRRARSKAAKLLKENQGKLRRVDHELADIDDILDFLEDIGFYEHGDQITTEVAHHHFYHWIKGYYLASRDYIGAWQDKEPTRWEHISELFSNTHFIENKLSKGKVSQSLTDEQISIFLTEEIAVCPQVTE